MKKYPNISKALNGVGDPEGTSYKIVRMFRDPNGPSTRTIKRGLTLAEAQKHCKDPETSSSTATSSAARARTKRYGAWFDGFDVDK